MCSHRLHSETANASYGMTSQSDCWPFPVFFFSSISHRTHTVHFYDKICTSIVNPKKYKRHPFFFFKKGTHSFSPTDTKHNKKFRIVLKSRTRLCSTDLIFSIDCAIVAYCCNKSFELLLLFIGLVFWHKHYQSQAVRYVIFFYYRFLLLVNCIDFFVYNLFCKKKLSSYLAQCGFEF